MDKFLTKCLSCNTIIIAKINNTLILDCECQMIQNTRIFYGDRPLITRNKYALHRINYWNDIDSKWN